MFQTELEKWATAHGVSVYALTQPVDMLESSVARSCSDWSFEPLSKLYIMQWHYEIQSNLKLRHQKVDGFMIRMICTVEPCFTFANKNCTHRKWFCSAEFLESGNVNTVKSLYISK